MTATVPVANTRSRWTAMGTLLQSMFSKSGNRFSDKEHAQTQLWPADHPHVDRAHAFRLHDDGIDLDVADEMAMVEIEVGEAADRVEECLDVGGGLAAEAGQELGGFELA